MKLSSSDQKTVNDFFREHIDRSYKTPMNCIRMNVDHTSDHRVRIFEICNLLIDSKIPFWTEVRMKNGCIPDILAPTHITRFIEVLGTETPEDFFSKKFHKYESCGFGEKDFLLIDAKVELQAEELW